MPNKYVLIDRPVAREMRESLTHLLKVWGDAHGVEVQLGNATFTGRQITFKNVSVTIKSVDGSGQVVEDHNKEREDYRLYCNRFGLKAEWLGQNVSFRGQTYKILGLRPKSHSYPVLCKRVSDGTLIKLANFTVSNQLSSPSAGTQVPAVAGQPVPQFRDI